jgi:hypothetical protein
MVKNHKIKILHSEYVEKSDLIKWDVLFLDDNLEQSYVWPSVDLLQVLKITGEVDASLLHKFCADMQDKTINLVIDKNVETPEPHVAVKEYEQINQKLADHFTCFKKFSRGH